MKQFISNYKEFIKKPILEQVRIIAKSFSKYHQVDLNKNYSPKPNTTVNEFHSELENTSILYDIDTQSEALGISKHTILHRIKRHREQ